MLESVNLACILQDYWDFQEVYSKWKTKTLPPYRSFNSASNLLPAAAPPTRRLFSLSPPDHQAIENYITEALSLGFIHPSTSPAGPGSYLLRRKKRICGLALITVALTSRPRRIGTHCPILHFNACRGWTFFQNWIHIIWSTSKPGTSGRLRSLCYLGTMSIWWCPLAWWTPMVFQRFINEVFRETMNDFTFVYGDDI